MCGIVAFHGETPALPRLLGGLERLEYRGYDSAGVALAAPSGALVVRRAQGRLAALREGLVEAGELPYPTGIGHTRWATHGAPTERNAHPHRDCSGRIAVVHNGTIDNAEDIRLRLARGGHNIDTEVDTEVVAHLVEEALRARPGSDLDALVAAVAEAVSCLEGAWALAIVAAGVEGIVLARHRSPLLIAEAGDALLASSDALGFSGDVRTVREMSDRQIVALGGPAGLRWFDAAGKPAAVPAPLRIDLTRDQVGPSGGERTNGEIAEQPQVVQRLLDKWLQPLAAGESLPELAGLSAPRRVRLVACGSSYYAAQVTARMLGAHLGIPARVVVASEHRGEITEPDTLTVAFSQSGETADVLTVREAWGGRWLVVTNAPHSTMARRCEAVLDLECGPELGVAATKSFTAQVVAGTALALALGNAAGLPAQSRLSWVRSLAELPCRLLGTHAQVAPIAAKLAIDFADAPGWIFVSRGAGVPYAYEGALKLKELAYRWTEVLPAGELKHGPIALVDDGVPVVVVEAEPRARLATNVHELRARGAEIISVGGRGATMPCVQPDVEPPWGPLEAVVGLQHLAREVTMRLGNDVDRPRNLAKSVTVE